MTTIIHKPENFSTGQEIYAVVSVDENGKQGIVGNPFPFVSLQKEIVEVFREQIKELEQHTKQELRIVKFSNPEMLFSNK